MTRDVCNLLSMAFLLSGGTLHTCPPMFIGGAHKDLSSYAYCIPIYGLATTTFLSCAPNDQSHTAGGAASCPYPTHESVTVGIHGTTSGF